MNVKAPAALATAVVAALSLAGCSPPRAMPAKPPLAGARIGGPFTLVDQDGRVVTDRDFTGKYRIVYFGYTYCPDVCPTDLQTVGAGLKLLEHDRPLLAARITPIFVTVDPARDTPAVLKRYVANFHPRMVGLTGSPAAIAAAARAFAVYYQRGDTTAGGAYLMNHSRQTYLMDPDGKPLALLPADGDPRQLADEILRWAS